MRNASANQQPRLVIELKRDANANVVLNNLFKQTPLQTSFGVNMLALVDGVPRTLNLAQALSHYVDHQIEVIRRRSEYRLEKARNRAHIVEGLLRAIDMLDAVIATIRASADRPEARTALMAEPFSFTEVQATHILDMTLGRLTRLGRSELEEEMDELRATIAELEAILSDDGKLRGVIETEMVAIRDKHANQRRSVITHDPGEMGVEDLIDDEEIVVTMTRAGYIKSVAAAAFRTQGRGGRGVQGARLKEEDLVSQVVHTSAHAYLLALLEPGQGVPPAGPRDPDEGSHRAWHGRGQPRAAGAERVDHGHHRDARVLARPVPRVRHRAGAGQEDRDERVRQVASGGLHRHQPARRRRAGACRGHVGPGRPLRGHAQRHDDPLQRGGRAAHGPGRRRRARASGSARATWWCRCDVAADDTDILIVTDAGYGKRTKLERFNRQARGGQGVRGIRLTGHPGHGGRRRSWSRSTRRSCSSPRAASSSAPRPARSPRRAGTPPASGS